MVTGNYVLYGVRPSSESEVVDDHVQEQTIERRPRRKVSRLERTASELERTLKMAQMDNDTDSIKYEKRVREPRLLRYVSTSDVEEAYVTTKFETYDRMRPRELGRRYNFTKKARNPADGSVNYGYSHSSSGGSSPSGPLPSIAEHGTYRTAGTQPAASSYEDLAAPYENKLDKYFTRPKELNTYTSKVNYDGSHPDSLYRVSPGAGAGGVSVLRMLRVARWPLALLAICIALATFVYFLMPDTSSRFDSLNGTYWEHSVAEEQTTESIKLTERVPETTHETSTQPIYRSTQNTSEIDFYDKESDKVIDFATLMDTINDSYIKEPLPVAPVFPEHLTPEVQYGNEKLDTDKLRRPKAFQNNVAPEESTLRPHITQKPEKPLAIYFKEGSITSSSESSVSSESIANVNNFEPKLNTRVTSTAKYAQAKPIIGTLEKKANISQPILILPSVGSTQGQAANTDLNFTSGHSKLFGISMEHAEKMKSTTQSSAYRTRVSPTLPTWRDLADTTTKKYPINVNIDVPNCRSPQQSLCRGVLPYDLSGPPHKLDGVEVSVYLPQLSFLVAANCSARLQQFACALLEPECSPPPYPTKKPCYNLCREIAESCEGTIPRELSAVFDCDRYPKSHCVAAKSPCFEHELTCSDGTCISKEWTCDGRADCSEGEDEASCVPCEPSEFRCNTGGCILRRWVCDGYADCPGGEDEAADGCGWGHPEQAEETAGSVLAPVVRHPARSNADKHVENDSQELLMTSDSSNALKRNFTRRPALSRLTPYTKPKPTTTQDNQTTTTTKQTSHTTRHNTEPLEEAFLGLLELQKEKKESSDKKKVEQHRSLKVKSNLTRSEKTLLSKAAATTTTSELLNKTVEKDAEEEALFREVLEVDSAESVLRDAEAHIPEYTPIISSHMSPCPSGELRCVDGRCITLAQLCDGVVDCSDNSDEDHCFS